jgi:lipopolysaccharide/colanic/teichoic acid biosynthesis glycosyltransferase
MSATDTSQLGLDQQHAAALLRPVSLDTDRPKRQLEPDTRGRELLQASVPHDAGTSSSPDLQGVRVSLESGLPCYWRNDVPVLPDPSASLNRKAHLAAKRVFDVVVAGLALILLSPLFLAVAIAIRIIDPGTVFFRQYRTGLDGKPFRIFKFRSMYLDQCDDTGVLQTVADDQRVMPLGRILRKTSVDELPQLINVVLGDMSLVGPRPHVAGQLAGKKPYEEVISFYGLRHAMRPGLTGWAQANGYRGPTDDIAKARARITHDIAYIQNFSFWLDLRILAKTALKEFVNGGGF